MCTMPVGLLVSGPSSPDNSSALPPAATAAKPSSQVAWPDHPWLNRLLSLLVDNTNLKALKEILITRVSQIKKLQN